MSDESDDRLGDMPADEFRAAAHDVADRVARYLEDVESYRVLPEIAPGAILKELPEVPPRDAEPLATILDDYAKLIEPNITHWQHPGFMAFFPSVALGPGILGEWLAAGLNSNVMFWKNAPASTELEQRVVDWLRQMVGLPADFDGMLTDTASISTLSSLVAARHAIDGLEARQEGLAGREGLSRLRIYASTEAHSSIHKAAIVTGIGLAGVRSIPVDAEFRMQVDALERAIAEDRGDGWLPFCVVGALGTTSSTSVDPAAALADVCAREKLWFHVDAAYAGAAALAPEYRAQFSGWERADSIVINPHKWMFAPFDASLLLFREPERFREAFSIIPGYLSDSQIDGVRNYSEYGIQLGRRFRALKLWIMIRYFGTDGFADRIREHCRQAREFAAWIDAAPDWERLAPVPFGTVCFRFRPPDPGDSPDDRSTDETLDAWNAAILERVNRSGEIYLSQTRLDGRVAIRVAFGNPRTTRAHAERCWILLRQAASTVPSNPS